MIDSHCHIGFDELKDDIDAIVTRAIENGVEKILTVGCGEKNLSDLCHVLDRFENVYGAFGIHPNEAEEVISAEKLSKFIQSHPKIIAVGETGLDYYYNDTPKEIQIQNFMTHIEVATKLGLPLIVHTRDAEKDTIECLRTGARNGNLKGVLHCFTGSKKLAEAAQELGFYLSASGIITFKINANNEKYQTDLLDTFATYPTELLLVETDSPYLTPVPKRGKKNEPAYLPYTLAKLAELKSIPIDDMEKITTESFYNLFLKGKI